MPIPNKRYTADIAQLQLALIEMAYMFDYNLVKQGCISAARGTTSSKSNPAGVYISLRSEPSRSFISLAIPLPLLCNVHIEIIAIMEAIEQALEAAFANHDLPGIVLTAQDKTGKISYSKAIGKLSYEDDANPIQIDSTFYLASTSKLVTTIAALQSVERGHFRLDEDVTRILPEFKGIQILTGFDEESGEPILVTSTRAITLRYVHPMLMPR